MSNQLRIELVSPFSREIRKKMPANSLSINPAIITVRKQGGIAELCLPELDFDKKEGSYCEQYCDYCLKVCPTGAIRALTLEEKQMRKIATASIIRDACIAWHDKSECLACDEYCGYQAIELKVGGNGIPKPVVNPDKCRGCGACRNVCPATRIGNAVEMKPVIRQRFITPEEDASTYLKDGGGHHNRHGGGAY